MPHGAGEHGQDPLGDRWAQSPNVRLAMLVQLFQGHFRGAESRREAAGDGLDFSQMALLSKTYSVKVFVFFKYGANVLLGAYL